MSDKSAERLRREGRLPAVQLVRSRKRRVHYCGCGAPHAHDRRVRIIQRPHEFLTFAVFRELNENANERVFAKIGKILRLIIGVLGAEKRIVRCGIREPALLQILKARLNVPGRQLKGFLRHMASGATAAIAVYIGKVHPEEGFSARGIPDPRLNSVLGDRARGQRRQSED